MIYIVSTGNYASGGTETLHQAAKLLASMGEDVGMYYVQPHTMEIPQRFKDYNVEAVDNILDIKYNIIIVPEVFTYLLNKYKKIRKCIWWLSLDFYLKTEPISLVNWRMKVHRLPKILFPISFIVLIAKGNIHTYRYHFEDDGAYFQTYNCEYAHRYIIEHGVPEERTLYLCGPLNQSFFKKAEELKGEKRENIIIYNPKKGKMFTDKLIEQARIQMLGAEFKPIQDMTPDQVADLMARAKIYIDFGDFPGPERIPREAVTMGCNIITSRNGSAANDVDVPIPEEMKFEDKEENIPVIIDKLRDMLENYEEYYPYYDDYRKKVANQVVLLSENMKILLERI